MQEGNRTWHFKNSSSVADNNNSPFTPERLANNYRGDHPLTTVVKESGSPRAWLERWAVQPCGRASHCCIMRCNTHLPNNPPRKSQRNSHAANTGVLGRTRIILSSVLGGVGD